MRRTAALIVGGGPAGCAAAIGLARAGIVPELIERTAGPHDVVCGGFLGWDALAALRGLGIEPGEFGARPIARLRLASGTRMREATLPYAAAGMSRRALDEAMLAAAVAAGANVSRGRVVRSADPAARSVRIDDGSELFADALLLATGKHELRGAPRPAETSNAPVGIRAALPASQTLTKALDGVIELHPFDGGYGGLLIQEDGSVNLSISLARWRLKATGGVEAAVARLAEELPLLGERLAGTQGLAWSAVAGVPYGWRARSTLPGIYRIGDQGAVIASLAGDGIAIALASGIDAAAAIAAGTSADDYQRAFARRAARPLKVAEALRWAAERRMPRAAMICLLGWMPGLASVAARLTRIG